MAGAEIFSRLASVVNVPIVPVITLCLAVVAHSITPAGVECVNPKSSARSKNSSMPCTVIYPTKVLPRTDPSARAPIRNSNSVLIPLWVTGIPA